MARFLLQGLAITIFASVLELVLPWWSIAIAAFVGGLIFKSGLNFVAGFLAIALLWLITALTIDISSASDLASRVAKIFMVNTPILLGITALLGGLVGGFAAMAGASLRRDKRKLKYY
jgi:hypothetical protein